MTQVDVFEILADPSRRRIVEALRQGERSVNDVAGLLGLAQPGVSRHLRRLLEAGFVQLRPHGNRRFYALRPERFRELEAWTQQYRQLWERRLDHFEQALQRRQGAQPKDPKGGRHA